MDSALPRILSAVYHPEKPMKPSRQKVAAHATKMSTSSPCAPLRQIDQPLDRATTARLGTDANVSAAAAANAQQAQISAAEGYHHMISWRFEDVSPFARNAAKSAKPCAPQLFEAGVFQSIARPVSAQCDMIRRC